MDFSGFDHDRNVRMTITDGPVMAEQDGVSRVQVTSATVRFCWFDDEQNWQPMEVGIHGTVIRKDGKPAANRRGGRATWMDPAYDEVRAAAIAAAAKSAGIQYHDDTVPA